MLSDTPTNLGFCYNEIQIYLSISQEFGYMRGFATGAGIDAKNPVINVNN